jgi:hypothetical protein
MKIINEVNNETVRQACRLVQDNFFSDGFLISLEDKKFNYTDDDFFDITKNTKSFNKTVYVKPYTSLSPWSKVIGYATDNTIYINTRKLNLPLKDRIENIRHEIFHLQGYSHKGNRVTEFNLKTVPFKGASLFVKYLESVGKV